VTFSSARKRLGRVYASLALGACLTALGLLAAGCGSSPTPSVASLNPTTTTSGGTSTTSSSGAGGGPSSAKSGGGQGQGQEVTMAGGNRNTMAAFSACMRKNGEPNFPDPNAQGQLSFGSANGIDPGSAQFRLAQQACQKLLPNGGSPTPAQQAQFKQQALAFSACMRKHGVPKFPDPNFGAGHVALQIGPNSGIDPRSPQFQAAQQACQQDLPGKVGAIGGPPALGAAASAKAGGG
jgi:hypothetical protein